MIARAPHQLEVAAACGVSRHAVGAGDGLGGGPEVSARGGGKISFDQLCDLGMQPAEQGKPQNAAELSDWDRTVYTYFGKRSAVVPLGQYIP